jgi:hypothetical protein
MLGRSYRATFSRVTTAAEVIAALAALAHDDLAHDTGARRQGRPIYELTECGLQRFILWWKSQAKLRGRP